MNKLLENKIDNLISAKQDARSITKDAKHLDYPVTDIVVKLSSLADEHGLTNEMEELLDSVRESSNKLQSAFFQCEEVFTEAIRDTETTLEELEAV